MGTRGWMANNWNSEENYKILKRENERFKLSIQDGLKKFGKEKQILAFLHYPPFFKENVPEEINWIKTMKNYKIKTCFYGHLHGEAHKEAFEGELQGIEFKLVSADFLKFQLKLIEN